MAFSKEQHLKDNIRALQVISLLDREKRQATAAEKAELFKYSGFGGLSFVLRDPNRPDAWPQYEKHLLPPTRELYSVIETLGRDENDYRRHSYFPK